MLAFWDYCSYPQLNKLPVFCHFLRKVLKSLFHVFIFFVEHKIWPIQSPAVNRMPYAILLSEGSEIFDVVRFESLKPTQLKVNNQHTEHALYVPPCYYWFLLIARIDLLYVCVLCASFMCVRLCFPLFVMDGTILHWFMHIHIYF